MRSFVLLLMTFFASQLCSCLHRPDAAALSGGGQYTVDLVREGRAVSSIVLPAEPTDTEALAAKDLVDHLAMMTGATLTQGAAPVEGLLPIYIGAAAQPGLLERVTAESNLAGTYMVRVQPDRIDLIGTDTGAHYAACDILEQLGVRWYMPGELGLVMPKQATAAIREQAEIHVPSFGGRNFQGLDNVWKQRNRCGGEWFPSAHGLPGMVGAAGKKLFAEHPEYYSLRGEERQYRQACVSNPELLDYVVEVMKGRLKKDPDMRIYGMGPNDGGNFCECEKCKALDGDDYDPFSAEHSVTDRYIWFFNQLLDRLEPEYPDLKIGFYIYHNYMRPPVKVVPNKRITGTLAPIALCRVHGPNNPVCPEKQYYEWLAVEWGKLIPEVWDRGYWSNLACPGFTFPIVHRLREQIPMGKRAGLYGWRVETFGHYGTQLPSFYIASRLMWNHEADVDALLGEFYSTFYGPAAESMGEYHELMDDTLRDSDHHTGCSWDMPNHYPPELRKKARRLIRASAKSVPADSIYGRRIQMITETMDMLDSFCDMMGARARADFVEAQEALERLDGVAETLMAYEPPMIGTRMYTSYMNRFFRLPTEQGFARMNPENGHTVLAATEDEWDFQIDPMQVGIALHWEKAGITGANWQRIKTATESWSNQGLRYYRGLAWYRQTVDVTEEVDGKRVFLWCGGVDDLAKVWINGKMVGISHGAAFYPFELDATGLVRKGTNTIAVAVNNERVNEIGTGGLVTPIVLYIPKEGEAAVLENKRDMKRTFP